MDYSTSIPFVGDSASAFDLATSVLTGNGFRLVQQQEMSLEFEGPGMNSTRQNPLLGATWVRVIARHGRLDLEAELGGVRRMRSFLRWFPLAMAVLFFVLFGLGMGVAFGNAFGVGFGVPFAAGADWLLQATWLSILPLSPWLFISPVMSRRIRARTEQALVSMLASMTVASRGA